MAVEGLKLVKRGQGQGTLRQIAMEREATTEKGMHGREASCFSATLSLRDKEVLLFFPSFFEV